jgi:tetratricopeptide (TPR) repeat protein
VLGRRFRRTVLDELLAPERIHIDDATIEELSGFIEAEDEAYLRFRHNVVHDVAYGGLSFSKRRALHGRAGDVIEAQAGFEPESVAEYLATHYSLSGRHDKAWHYTVLAGNKAREAYANSEAANHYRRALEAAKALKVKSDERAVIYQCLGDALDRLGAFDDARVAYQRAQHLYEDPRARADVLRVQAAMLKRMGRLSSALRTQTKGLSIARSHELEDILVDLLAERATIRLYQGRYGEAVELADLAIDEADDRRNEAVALAEITKDWALTASSGNTQHDLTWSALKIAEELGDLHLQGGALNNLGMYAYYAGSWDDASDLYERAAETLRKTGDDIAAAYGEANIAEIKSEQGRLDEADSGFRGALNIFRAAGDSFMTVFVLNHLGRIRVRVGDFDAAFAYFDEAANIAEAMGAATEKVEIALRVTEGLVLAGRTDEAQRRLNERSELRPQNAPAQLKPLAHRVAGLTALCDGRDEAAQTAMRGALDTARELGSDIEELHAIHGLASAGQLDGELSGRATDLSISLGVVAVPVLPKRSEKPASRVI